MLYYKLVNGTVAKNLTQFVSAYPLLKYKKHETIIRAGEEPVGVYFIQKGYVRLYTISGEGKELTLLLFEVGEIFPMLWIFQQKVSEYYFEAFTPVEVRRCKRQEIYTYLRARHDTYEMVINDLVDRQIMVIKRLELLTFETARNRILKSLRVLARQFGKRIGNNILIPIPLTHRDIAAYTSMTRETASLEIEKLQKEKLIRHRGRYFVIQK